MRSNVLVLLLGLATQVPAQQSTTTATPFDIGRVVARASGLQAHPREDGLIGFGAGYAMRFRRAGARFEVAHARADGVAFVALSRPIVSRSSTVLPTHADVEPVIEQHRAVYRRADGIDERYEPGPDGVELSWSFARRPAGEGDLVVCYDIDTNLGQPTADDGAGLAFAGDAGGVRIGAVTGIDAAGARVDGTVQWDGTGMQLTLPAAFVDRAAYPVVLDPLVGSTFLVADQAGVIHPDAAYDATTGNWLVTWKKQINTTDIGLNAQLVSGTTGALIGSATLLDNQVSSRQRVVSHDQRDQFGIVYVRFGVPRTIELVRVSAITGGAIGGNTLASSNLTAPFSGLDVAAPAQPTAANTGFTVTYFDASTGLVAVKAQRVTYTGSGSTAVQPSITLWANNAASQFQTPAMSRVAGPDGQLLVVALRRTGSNYAIVGTVLDINSDVPLLSGVLVPDTTAQLSVPDVDGYASQWVIAYEAPGASLVPGPGITARPVTLGNGGTTFVVGNGFSLGGLLNDQASGPAVGWSPGRVWLAYRSQATFLTTTYSVRVTALDSKSCAFCNDTVSLPYPSSASVSLAVATATSGGVPSGENAVVVWTQTTSSTHLVLAQRLRNHGVNGTTATLGGGCGATGTVAFNHPPGIGSSGFRCSLDGIPATGLAPIFNFAPPTATVPCGGCMWTPFAVTQVAAIAGGSAFVEFPIPCLTTLIGQQFETQWTLLDVTQAPCPLLPGFAISNRSLLTIGN